MFFLVMAMMLFGLYVYNQQYIFSRYYDEIANSKPTQQDSLLLIYSSIVTQWFSLFFF